MLVLSHRAWQVIPIIAVTSALTACLNRAADEPDANLLPATDIFCLTAQQVVSNTRLPANLVVHDDFDAFVKSKAPIESDGPMIHQYNWRDEDGRLLGFACKMNSSDHLRLEFGADSAGPEGYCHDMNRYVHARLQQSLAGRDVRAVVFEPSESLATTEQQNMIGPRWLQPFQITRTEPYDDAVHIETRGFVIEFSDPRYQKFPPSWRGTHYCHLIAPEHLRGLMTGEVSPGKMMARKPTRGRTPESFEGVAPGR